MALIDHIDSTYFILDVNIPDSDYSDLDVYMGKYMPEILRKLLGYELAAYVLLYDPVTSPTRIKEFVEGVEYEIDDFTVRWNGLINDDLISLVAYYVYYWYTRNKAQNLQATGMMALQSENALPASPTIKLVNAWSRMIELYGYSGQDSYFGSAYNFLLEHDDDYPEWIFTHLETVNTWGI